MDFSLARGQVRLSDEGRADVAGLSVEIRPIGPSGERGEVWSTPLFELMGYREQAVPPGVLTCVGGVLATSDGPVAEDPRYTPLGASGGGCSVGGTGGLAAWWLVGIAVWAVRRRVA